MYLCMYVKQNKIAIQYTPCLSSFFAISLVDDLLYIMYIHNPNITSGNLRYRKAIVVVVTDDFTERTYRTYLQKVLTEYPHRTYLQNVSTESSYRMSSRQLLEECLMQLST